MPVLRDTKRETSPSSVSLTRHTTFSYCLIGQINELTICTTINDDIELAILSLRFCLLQATVLMSSLSLLYPCVQGRKELCTFVMPRVNG
jgi:hypothetical protein